MLFSDGENLPDSPSPGEAKLASVLGPEGIRVIDETLTRKARASWLKVARVVADALRENGYAAHDEDYVHLHVRRVIALVNSGDLQSQGDLRRPRWSEIRLSAAT